MPAALSAAMLAAGVMMLGGAAGPALSLDFTTGSLDSRITFSRTTHATLFDSTGKLTYAPNNMLLRSQEFDNGAWAKLNATITADTVVAPDGTVTADTLTTSGVGVAQRVSQSINFVGNIIASVYAKANTVGYLQIINSSDAQLFANFDLLTGVVGTKGSNVISSGIENAGNGWHRCWVVQPHSTSNNIMFYASTGAGAAFGASYSANVHDFYLWGAQIEAVTYQTTPRPYIATTSAAYYGPRFDYDPVTLAAKGLLVEEARTNLNLHSSGSFNSTARWAKTGVTVADGNATSIDGTTSASLVTSTGNANNVIFEAVNPTSSAGTFTGSRYVKRGTATWVAFSLWSGSGTNGVNVWFNLATGAKGSSAATTGFTYVDHTITDVGNGFYRVTVTGTIPAAATYSAIRIVDGDAAFNYTAVSGLTYFMDGAQFELGSFATRYQPSAAASVTRAASLATITGTGFSNFYNATEGSLYAEFRTPASGVRTVCAFDDNTANEAIILYTTGTSLRFKVVDGGVTQCDIVIGTVAANTTYKVAARYKANDFAAIMNGGTVQVDTSGTLPTVDRARIGSSQAGEYLTETISVLSYYSTAQSDAALAALVA